MFETMVKDGLRRPVLPLYTAEALDDASQTEMVFQSMSIQTDGTLYVTFQMGSIVIADAYLSKAADYVASQQQVPPAAGSGLSAVGVASLATAGAVVLLGAALVFVRKRRADRFATTEYHRHFKDLKEFEIGARDREARDAAPSWKGKAGHAPLELALPSSCITAAV
jgi:hypothetical protein